MLSQSDILKNEYLDFCGNQQPDFSLMDTQKAEMLISGIENDLTFSELVLPFEENLDQLACCAVYAFSHGKLSRAAVANFLEYRSLKKDFLNVRVIDFDKNYLDKNFSYSRFFLMEIMDHYFPYNITLQYKFMNFLKKMPSYEACFFSADIPDEHLKEVRISNFLNLAEKLKIIKKVSSTHTPLLKPRDYPDELGTTEPEGSKEITRITIGSMSVKDAVTKSMYGQHAKKAYPRLSEFSIDMMGKSIENYGRYISVDYPGIPTTSSFHKIESSPTYVGLHDEVHRRLISTIPNPAYAAFIDAIHLVREKTGFKWSREIWDAMDMEVGKFLDPTIDYETELNSIESNTKYFSALLHADVYTEERMVGLFTASPYIDTTWLLLIDIALEPEKWKIKGIDFGVLNKETNLSNSYILMHEFVLKNKDKIANLSSAEQVALLKSAWFDIPLQDATEAKFVKTEQAKQPRYIQTIINDKPIVQNKNDAIKMRRELLSASAMDILLNPESMNYILYEPYIFNNKFFVRKILELRINLEPSFLHQQDLIIKSFFKFNIRSVNDLLQFEKKNLYDPFSLQNIEVISETAIKFMENIISVALKEDGSFGQLKWNMFDLYSLFQYYPNHKQAIIQSIILHHPDQRDLFTMIDRKMETFSFANFFDFKDKSNSDIFDLMEKLYQMKLLDDSLVNHLLQNDSLYSFTIKNAIRDKDQNFTKIYLELTLYINKASSSSTKLFDSKRNDISIGAAKKLRDFLDNGHNMMSPQDLMALGEPGTFLDGIVNRCREGGISLPESLTKKARNTESLKKSY